MTTKAEKFKKLNKLNYTLMSKADLYNLPLLTGIYDFASNFFKFKLICIKNDDASVVSFFWKNAYDTASLDLWGKISNDEGIYIDVGSHTGLYTIISLLSNKKNFVVSIEPSLVNMGRMISNLRLNDIGKNNSRFLGAASKESKIGFFKTNMDFSHMSKGGKISNEGDQIAIIRLDDIKFGDKRNIKGIKIDTEGEDYNVLLGAKGIIKLFLPKIIIEVRENNKNLIKLFLDQFGYKFYLINDIKNSVDLSKVSIKNVINVYASIN